MWQPYEVCKERECKRKEHIYTHAAWTPLPLPALEDILALCLACAVCRAGVRPMVAHMIWSPPTPTHTPLHSRSVSAQSPNPHEPPALQHTHFRTTHTHPHFLPCNKASAHHPTRHPTHPRSVSTTPSTYTLGLPHTFVCGLPTRTAAQGPQGFLSYALWGPGSKEGVW